MQAVHAVFLYFEMLQQPDQPEEGSDVTYQPKHDTSMKARTPPPESVLRKSTYVEAGYEVKSDSPEWDAVLKKLAAEIKVRHYSRKTLKTYANWSRRFQRFLKNKPPSELSTADVLLQANYDIRVIQKLLGHASLKTTMIYTHCVPVRTVKEPKSPLDFDSDAGGQTDV